MQRVWSITFTQRGVWGSAEDSRAAVVISARYPPRRGESMRRTAYHPGMRTRKLGRTGLEVSEVGFGAWGIAGTLWLGRTEADARRALAAAHDAGVTFFDTALAYGDGISERLIGETLRAPLASGAAVVASKIPPKNRLWPARPDSAIA